MLEHSMLRNSKFNSSGHHEFKIKRPMPPTAAMLCIFALMLPLAESAPPPLTAALADARIMEPEAVARALTEVVRIDPTTSSAEGGWLTDLRGFDGPERQELSDLLRSEGVGLADRSKVRRLATAAPTAIKDGMLGILRRVQQADGREDLATKKQLTKQQGDHADTAQPSAEQADDGSRLSADSASPSVHLVGIHRSTSRSDARLARCMR